MSDPRTPGTEPDRRPSAPTEPPKIPATRGGNPQGSRYPNPPELVNPDAATLRDQWWYAIRQYSKWYSHAWGTAILAGVSFFALGWLIKGSNPIHSFKSGDTNGDKHTPGASDVSQPR